MTDSPSPSDTPALTEGGALADRQNSVPRAGEYGDLLERLGNLATYLAMAAGHEDEIGTVDDAQVAITALQAELQRYRSMFDAAGNYIPHSQIEGDLRVSQARIDALTAEVARLRDKCESGAALLEVVSDNARDRDDINTWSMTSVMAANLRAALSPVKQEPNDG